MKKIVQTGLDTIYTYTRKALLHVELRTYILISFLIKWNIRKMNTPHHIICHSDISYIVEPLTSLLNLQDKNKGPRP